MVGTWQGAAARFDNPAEKASAHYGIKLDGGLIHWLEEYNTAYHAGNYPMNQRSIGIEHEDGGDYNGVRPDALYTTSAKLVRDICQFYSIPIDRQHILKHNEVSDSPTGCPDALDIDRIVREASAVVDPCIDERNANWDIVIAVGNQLHINPDPNNKPATAQKFVEAIKALQDKPMTTIVQPVENHGSLPVTVTATFPTSNTPLEVPNPHPSQTPQSLFSKLVELIRNWWYGK
jgi:hypothetical protein